MGTAQLPRPQCATSFSLIHLTLTAQYLFTMFQILYTSLNIQEWTQETGSLPPETRNRYIISVILSAIKKTGTKLKTGVPEIPQAPREEKSTTYTVRKIKHNQCETPAPLVEHSTHPTCVNYIYCLG